MLNYRGGPESTLPNLEFSSHSHIFTLNFANTPVLISESLKYCVCETLKTVNRSSAALNPTYNNGIFKFRLDDYSKKQNKT